MAKAKKEPKTVPKEHFTEKYVFSNIGRIFKKMKPRMKRTKVIVGWPTEYSSYIVINGENSLARDVEYHILDQLHTDRPMGPYLGGTSPDAHARERTLTYWGIILTMYSAKSKNFKPVKLPAPPTTLAAAQLLREHVHGGLCKGQDAKLCPERCPNSHRHILNLKTALLWYLAQWLDNLAGISNPTKEEINEVSHRLSIVRMGLRQHSEDTEEFKVLERALKIFDDRSQYEDDKRNKNLSWEFE